MPDQSCEGKGADFRTDFIPRSAVPVVVAARRAHIGDDIDEGIGTTLFRGPWFVGVLGHQIGIFDQQTGFPSHQGSEEGATTCWGVRGLEECGER